MATGSPSTTLSEDALVLAKRFSVITKSHKRLPLDAGDRLATGERLTLVSGTVERPVLELALWLDETVVGRLAWSITVDQTLPPRMRAQAESLALAFTHETDRTSERKS